jgi:transposase
LIMQLNGLSTGLQRDLFDNAGSMGELWSPRGERLVGEVPMGHWETLLIKGAMNGEAFLAYIEQCLAPTLRRRDIVVIDNVSFHKVAGVEEAIEARGAELRYLPKYSPDLNPIELVFHPLKALLRKAAERTVDRLQRCVRSFIRGLKPAECTCYFRHAGLIHYDRDVLVAWTTPTQRRIPKASFHWYAQLIKALEPALARARERPAGGTGPNPTPSGLPSNACT